MHIVQGCLKFYDILSHWFLGKLIYFLFWNIFFSFIFFRKFVFIIWQCHCQRDGNILKNSNIYRMDYPVNIAQFF